MFEKRHTETGGEEFIDMEVNLLTDLEVAHTVGEHGRDPDVDPGVVDSEQTKVFK